MSVATPTAPPAGRWAGRDVSVAEVCARLGRLRDPGGDREPMPLASTLTLLGFAPDPDELSDMAAVLRRMGDHQPSRAVLLATRPGPRQALDATVEAAAHPSGAGCVWVELVTMTLSGVPAEALASAAVPLLRFDLPTFLWWPDAPDPRTHPPLPALARLADRLVSESGRAADPGDALGRLARWCDAEGPALSDLGWAAITPWRQLVAQLVDPDALAGLRAGPARLQIAHAGSRAGVQSLLMGGWLREVVGAGLTVTLSPRPDPGRATGLVSLRLSGQAGRALEIARHPGRDTAEVIVTEPDGRTRRRVLPLPTADRASLLAGELELPRRDRPFERALPHAAALAGGRA